MNEQRSKLSPSGLGSVDGTPFVSRTMVIAEIAPNKYRTTQDDTNRTGQKRHTEFVIVCDGQEHPSPIAGSAGVTYMCQHIDSSRDRIVRKRGQQVVVEANFTLSNGGKVLTLKERGIRNGKPFDEVLVFEKQ
jgi:hypothetical protein